jgi:beta-lactamase class C
VIRHWHRWKRLLTRRVVVSSAAGVLLGVFIMGASGTADDAHSKSGREPHSPTLAISDAQRRATVIDYARLDGRLQALSDQPAVVGLAVGVVEDGQITFLKGYGETIAGSGDTVTPDTVFRWASLSKGVAGAMVAKLAAEGRLSLYEPINKYSASLRLPAGNEYRATVADVLSHQLGLFSHANESKLEDGADPRILRAELATLHTICPVGQCHAYQNVAYDAASEVVERVTGDSYEKAIRERLFLPLGMTSATISKAGLEHSRSWARPHVGGKNSRPVEVTEPYYRVPAAGGVNGSIKDLARWLQAQMGSDPDVLSTEVLGAIQSPRTATPGELGRMRKVRERLSKATYGLGWRIYDYSGHTIVGHRGGVRGYRSLILFDPVLKTGVVALWNSATSQPSGLEFELLDMLYKLPERDWLGLDTVIARSQRQQPSPA